MHRASPFEDVGGAESLKQLSAFGGELDECDGLVVAVVNEVGWELLRDDHAMVVAACLLQDETQLVAVQLERFYHAARSLSEQLHHRGHFLYIWIHLSGTMPIRHRTWIRSQTTQSNYFPHQCFSRKTHKRHVLATRVRNSDSRPNK